jgi:hypothetical protein
MSITQIDSNNIQPSTLALLSPTVSSVQVTDSSYNVVDDTSVSTSGGYIKITGTNFNAGVQVYIGTTLATSIAILSSTVLQVQVPATTVGSYDVIVVNSTGTYGLKPLGITISPVGITWVTDSTLPNPLTGTSISIQLDATGATGYQLQSGSSLPSGLSLSSGGLLSGSITVANETTYSFTVEAYDAELQDSPKTFSLTVTTDVTVDYLVVAGGGGGGYWKGGGGGGGGLIYATSQSFAPGITYSVTVGDGGISNSGTGAGEQGGNSSISGTGFTTVTAIGGGGGGAGAAVASGFSGGDGGSGGGGGGNAAVNDVSEPGGLGTPGQGNNGGAGWAVGNSPSGGGGGAGASGGNAANSYSGPSGNGGSGLLNSITGTSTYYAGGGGGGSYNAGYGSGGAGGGGRGGLTGSPAVAGTTNTGGGGGGSCVATGKAGGSGVVIIRCPSSVTASSTTGSPVVTVSGNHRIYTFNASGTISF